MKYSLILLLLIVLINGCVGQTESSTAYDNSQVADIDNQENYKIIDDEFRNSSSKSTDKINCNLGWYDTHLHLEEDIIAEEVGFLMQNHNVNCAFGFIGFDFEDENLDDEFELAEEKVSWNNGFIPFFHLDDTKLDKANIENLEILYNGPINFKGYGETAFYREPLQGKSLLNSPWPEIFQFADENDLIVMIHLRQDQSSELDRVLNNYPNVKTLVHGNELINKLPALLREHDNLYYTLDTSTLLFLDETLPIVLMYPNSGGKNEFIQVYDANKELMLGNAIEDWIPIIEVAPNRILWGTDVSMSWHLDEEVYSRLIEFSEMFIERIPEQYREKYKHENAFNMVN